MRTLDVITKTIAGYGHIKVTARLSDGSNFSHVTTSTQYTDYVDDEEWADRQKEAIKMLSKEIQEANNLGDNWEPIDAEEKSFKIKMVYKYGKRDETIVQAYNKQEAMQQISRLHNGITILSCDEID